MSDKIKSKDLQYDSTLPPFLQRLHDQNAGRGDLDRHERALARPKRSKDPGDDDGPTIVDESGQVITKEQLQELHVPGPAADATNVKGEIEPATEPVVSSTDPDNELPGGSKCALSNLTDGTALRKRKLARVVGREESEEGAENDLLRIKGTKKAKKKAKPVKLAFDRDDETGP